MFWLYNTEALLDSTWAEDPLTFQLLRHEIEHDTYPELTLAQMNITVTGDSHTLPYPAGIWGSRVDGVWTKELHISTDGTEFS
jgi:hypothetical protein